MNLVDMYEAGKYLFLGGGGENIKYREAVSIFLQRHNKKDAYGFFALMPKRFVAAEPELYPESVRKYIKEHGFKKKDLGKIRSRYSGEAAGLSIYEKAFFGRSFDDYCYHNRTMGNYINRIWLAFFMRPNKA